MSKRKAKTNKELQALALDIFKNNVFTNKHILPNDQGLVQLIFMPLSVMTKDQLKDLLDEKPEMFYEYYHKAGPSGINGYPVFTSFHFLNQDESVKLNKYLYKITESLNKLK